MDEARGSVEVVSQQESADKLLPGKEITIASWTDLDRFVQQAAKSLNPRITNGHFTQYDSLLWKRGWPKPLSTGLKELDDRRKFHGRSEKMRVTILPPDISFTRKPQAVDASQAVTFLVERDLYSTGRGTIITDMTQCSVYVRTEDIYHIPKLAIRGLNDREVKEVIQRLLSDSRLEALRARVLGYMQVPVSAGLPSLGKKR